MEERIARTIREIETLDRLTTFENNVRQRNALTDELKAAINARAIDIGRAFVEQKTGLDLSHLSPAEEKIVQAVSEYVSVKKREGKPATRTINQLSNRGLIDAAEAAVSRSRPTQGFQTLADEDLVDLSYEQIVVDHPDEFSPRAIWFAKETLGLPNDSDKPPAKATTPTQMRTERLLEWLYKRSQANGGLIPLYTYSEAAAFLDMPDMHQFGRVFGNIQSRIDFACYLAKLPPLGLTAEAPFDRAWNQDNRHWAYPVADMQVAARTRAWSVRDFDRILSETEKLPGQAHISWIRELETNEDNVTAWAFGLQNQNIESINQTTSLKEEGLVQNVEELHLSCQNFLSLENSSEAEQNFFVGRIKNTKRFVALRNTDGVYIFAPGAYCAYRGRSSLSEWEKLGTKMSRGQGRLHLDHVLSGAKVEVGHSTYEELSSAYAEFCALRNIIPSIHEDPLSFWLVETDTQFAGDSSKDDGNEWTDYEFEAAVQAYVEMLDLEQAGQSYSSSNVHKLLQNGALKGRSSKSILFRMRNITSVLQGYGLPTVPGYTPADNVGPRGHGRISYHLQKLGVLDLSIFEPTDDPFELEERAKKIRSRLSTITPQGNKTPEKMQVFSSAFKRDPAVVAHVLNEAGDMCENCNEKAPFYRQDGTPYLEVHHIRTLADGGSDTIQNAVALCPNCHRHLHYGKGSEAAKEALYVKITRLIPE